MKRIGVAVILVLAFLGLADSTYLAQSERSGTPLICNIQNFSDCNTVVSSQYAHLFGIPLAEFGILFYGVLFVLAALELAIFNRLLRRALQAVSLVGIIASLYFTLIQAFVIDAFCIYCLTSAFIAFLVFFFASLIEPIRTNGNRRISPMAPPPTPPTRLTMPPAS